MKKKALLFVIIGVFFHIQPLRAQTWQPLKRLTWNAGHSYAPAICADSNNHIHAVWHDDSKDSNYEIFYKRSTNGGEDWTTKRLTNDPEYSDDPAISVDSNSNIHVIWADEITGNIEIYYLKGIQ